MGEIKPHKGKAKRDENGKLSISYYQKRIEQELAQMRITPLEVLRMRKGYKPPDANAEFEITKVEHIADFKCELCDHSPIVNVFTLKHKVTGRFRRVGIECAYNWADADIARAMLREMQRRKSALRNEVRCRAIFDWWEMFRTKYKADPDIQSLIRRLKQGRSIGTKSKARLTMLVEKLSEKNIDKLKDIVEDIKIVCQDRGTSTYGWNYILNLVKRDKGTINDYLFAYKIADENGLLND